MGLLEQENNCHEIKSNEKIQLHQTRLGPYDYDEQQVSQDSI